MDGVMKAWLNMPEWVRAGMVVGSLYLLARMLVEKK